jgi:uncharacterized membrane protein YebE (DUF533 family)
MNTRGLLDQLLKSGQQMLQGKLGGSGTPVSGRSAPASGGALGGLLGNVGGGTLAAGAAGAVGLLLGSKKARKLGGKALTYGGLTALGVMAYKAYGNWQAQQQTAPRGEPQTVDRIAAPQVEAHSQAILRALVAAAKADGHVDARERELIEGEFARLDNDADLQGWLHAELNKPLDPVEVARAATTTEMAAEMYIASVMMVDQEHFMERAYLDELAKQLSLDAVLKAELEAQVRQAAEAPVAVQ